MKDQLIEKLSALVNSEDIMSVREAVRDIRNDWRAETAKERQLQLDQFREREDLAEGEEFVYVPHELEERYNDLLHKYDERIDEHGKKLAAERQHNFELRSTLLAQFEELIRDEENIGKAFATHKEIKEKWDTIGDVPGDKYHEVQEKWHRLNQEFFYHIKIYKELQEHDLKINLRKKEELITEAQSLAGIDNINDLEVLVRKLHREWLNVGPSPRETFKELGDTFFGVLREAQTKIQAHYDELHAHSEENLTRKKALVDKMKEILGLELTQSAAWNKWAEEVKKLQEEWKTIGWARKKENEEVWQEFRGLCDLFFSKLKAHSEQRRAGYKENRDKKEELITRAKELQDSSDWKMATEEYKKLQDNWKKAGPADPREEQKLWQRFRSACDVFFQRKKEHFGEISDQQAENLRLKLDLLNEIENTALRGNKGADLALLKQFSERWNAIGYVPKDNVKEVMDRYNKALDDKYGHLNAVREEKEMAAFRSRLENIRSSSGDHVVKKEKSVLREKIDKLLKEIRQYENNMGFFTGKGAESMRKEIEKKIRHAEREIEELNRKLQMIDV